MDRHTDISCFRDACKLYSYEVTVVNCLALSTSVVAWD